MNQPAAKSTQPPNLRRSESAPLIRATVMIANIIWNAMKTYTGILVVPQRSPAQLMSVPPYWVRLPMTLFRLALPLAPNERLKP